MVSYIDPVMQHDLNSSTKPWALSPLISTMPHLAVQAGNNSKPEFPLTDPLKEDTGDLGLEGLAKDANAESRRAFFASAENRKKVTFGPDVSLSSLFERTESLTRYRHRILLRSISVTGIWSSYPR